MAANVYILSACDAWAEHSSMRILGVTTGENMLYAMLAAKIKAGDMEYDGSGNDAWRKFQKDLKNGDVNFNMLKYGFVQTYEDMQITEPISLAQFPEAGKAYEEITGAKVRADMERLGLDRRSFVYSVVDVHTGSGDTSFYMPGICDRDSLEENDDYLDFMDGADDTEVSVSVSSYSLGTGESEYPDEEEIAIIEQDIDELDEEYGIDPIQSDSFSFEYEAEQEEI